MEEEISRNNSCQAHKQTDTHMVKLAEPQWMSERSNWHYPFFFYIPDLKCRTEIWQTRLIFQTGWIKNSTWILSLYIIWPCDNASTVHYYVYLVTKCVGAILDNSKEFWCQNKSKLWVEKWKLIWFHLLLKMHWILV